MQKLKAIRGAVCTQNTKDSIKKDVCSLCCDIFKKNNIQTKDLVSIVFSVTQDIDALNPATAIRTSNIDIALDSVPLFCCQEPFIRGGLPFTIRVMVFCYKEETQSVHHIYLNGADVLRQDIANK